jgi:hypothetical protein
MTIKNARRATHWPNVNDSMDATFALKYAITDRTTQHIKKRLHEQCQLNVSYSHANYT